MKQWKELTPEEKEKVKQWIERNTTTEVTLSLLVLAKGHHRELTHISKIIPQTDNTTIQQFLRSYSSFSIQVFKEMAQYYMKTPEAKRFNQCIEEISELSEQVSPPVKLSSLIQRSNNKRGSRRNNNDEDSDFITMHDGLNQWVITCFNE